MGANLTILLMMALPLMGSPGPATLSVAAVAASYGPRQGVRYLCGIVLGTWSVLLLVALGVTGALLANPALGAAVTVLASLYILYLAYRIATAPPLPKVKGDASAPSLGSGLILALANPKAYAALGAVYSSVTVVEAAPTADATIKLVTLGVLVILCNGSWMLLGAALTRTLSDPRRARAVNIGFAMLLLASVALAVL